MKMRLVLAGLLAAQVASGMTWDEPWMEDVIRDADALVKADILTSGKERFSGKRLKQLAGVAVPESFEVVGYSMVQIHSMTGGHSEEFALRFNPELDYYLFLIRTDKAGEFRVASPQTGWAKILPDGNVSATYRHSYHQALVPDDVYQQTMVALFNKLHGQKVDTTFVNRYIAEQLAQRPALISKAGGDPKVAKEFFAQHVALECFRFFGQESDLPKLKPFLAADDEHVQASAVRALGGVNSPNVPDMLMSFIEADRSGFAKVVALDALAARDAYSLLPRLKKFIKEGKDEDTGWGGNIMDPRIGTYFPESVLEAARSLAASWEKGEKVAPRFGGYSRTNSASVR